MAVLLISHVNNRHELALGNLTTNDSKSGLNMSDGLSVWTDWALKVPATY